MKKAIPAAIVALLLMASLAGCASDLAQNQAETGVEQATVADNQTQTDASAATDATTATLAKAKEADVRRVGQDQYGYITIPRSWIDMQNYYPAQGAIQYTDGNGTIISLNIFSNDVDPQAALTSLVSGFEGEGYDNMTNATVTLYGETAYQASGYNQNSNEYIVMWMFAGLDGNVHYIVALGSDKSIVTATNIIQDTYSYHK